MQATFDRFDICGAHRALEADYHDGGWLQERPSNRRRMEATSIQLERIGYRPGVDECCSFDYLRNDNQRAIYVNALRAYGLPLDRDDETHASVWAFIDRKLPRVPVRVRRNTESRALELFFVNTSTRAPYWWLECYSRAEGHSECSRAYMNLRCESVDETAPDVLALLKEWGRVGPADTHCIPVLCARLNGPRGFSYEGE